MSETGGSFGEFDVRGQKGEPLTVVFFGASLTYGANATDQARTSYRARIADLLAVRYPKSPIRCFDAAIGGTGSQLGIFRVERDVLVRHPNLVFVDFSANDGITSDDAETLASYEAIIKRLVDERIPVVQVAFPFKWDINRSQLPQMKRLDAHHKISEAYGNAWGDAITLTIAEVESGKSELATLWNTDPVHPGDAGYQLFAHAAWNGFEKAVADHRIGHAPKAMLFPETYLQARRIRIADLGPLPQGWDICAPTLTSIYPDFQMSRWQDQQVIARNRMPPTPTGVPNAQPSTASVQPQALRLSVHAQTILLFGEATTTSGHFRIVIDGRTVRGHSEQEQEKDSDRFIGNRWKTGNGHQFIEVARGLDEKIEHQVEIIPLFSDSIPEEVRFESICVAGGAASAALVP